MDDNILRMYIDEIFTIYDTDRSGFLDKRQLVGFFNQLFAAFNDPRRVDQMTIDQLLTQCDLNHDQKVNKPELFTLFKRVLTGDNSVYGNLQQQQNWGQFQNPYQNQGGQYPYQSGKGYQGNQQYGGNNQTGQAYKNPHQGYQQFNNQHQQSWNSNQQQTNNQWGYGNQGQKGPGYY